MEYYNHLHEQFAPFSYYIMLVIGLLLIIKTSDFFVNSAIWIAKVTKIPDIIIGASLVSLCTTLPEAVVSATSSAKALPGMAFGNAFGSIVFNTTVILGITFLIARPPIQNKKSFIGNCTFLLIISAAVGILFLTQGEISKQAGFVLLFILILYLLFNIISALRGRNDAAKQEKEEIKTDAKSIFKNIALLLIGAAGVVLGSNLLVTNGELAAKSLGVSDLIIGLTITAMGTSLPELVTAIQSIIKKAHNLSVGNIIGADILNIVFVMGMSAVISPVRLESVSSALFSVIAAFVVCGFTLSLVFIAKKNFPRAAGAVLLLMYVAYVAVNIMYFAV